LGPCAGVRWVALDPLPLPYTTTATLPLVSVSRERFVRHLMGKRREELAGELVPIIKV
jgi:hypothetical protein